MNRKRLQLTLSAAASAAITISLTFSPIYAAPKDIQLHWSGTAVNTLMEKGIVSEYPDGRFKPDRDITRQEAASFLASYLRVIAPETAQQAMAQGAPVSYPDVGAQAGNAADIELLSRMKIISGYPDGTFRPEEFLSREAFSSMIYKLHEAVKAAETEQEKEANDKGEIEGKSVQQQGTDAVVPAESSEPTKFPESNQSQNSGTDSVKDSTKDSTKNSAKDSTTDSTTEPEKSDESDLSKENTQSEPTTRSESAEAATSGGVKTASPGSGFQDISGSYAKQAIMSLADRGVLHGYPDGTFRPQHDVTRGEAASVLYSLSGYEAQSPLNELPLSNVIEVPYISQVNPYQAWKGCEATSLLMAMKGKGYLPDMTLKEFLDGMPMHESNPAKGFAGSPYEPGASVTTRTTIYPAKLAEYAAAYGRVSDFSESSVEELQAEVLSGNPVVAYVTLFWKNPIYKSYKIEDEYQYLVSNNHALLVCGYDRETHKYFISDPYNYKDWDKEYKYWVDAPLFDRLYNVRKHALVVE